jgi:hypothetical protein
MVNLSSFNLKFLCIVMFSLSGLIGAEDPSCVADLTSSTFQIFVSTLEAAGDEEIIDVPQLCSAVGGDIFLFSGTTDCDGEVENHLNQPMCLPTSCTSNETSLALIIPIVVGSENQTCSGDYSYDSLGERTPDLFLCQNEFIEKSDLWVQFISSYTNETLKIFEGQCFLNLFLGNELTEECLPDYSYLPDLCEIQFGMDYFTSNYTETCNGGSSIDRTTNNVFCYPSSCTSNEVVLIDLLNSTYLFEPEAPCTYADFVFSGLNSRAGDDAVENDMFLPASTTSPSNILSLIPPTPSPQIKAKTTKTVKVSKKVKKVGKHKVGKKTNKKGGNAR